MNNKDKIDSLMRIAEFNIRQFNERRDYSWKISLGLWGIIIGGISVIVRGNVPKISVGSAIIVAILIVALDLYWLCNVFIADKRDKDLAFLARDIVINLVNDVRLEPPEKPNRENVWQDWSFGFQLGVTILLVIVGLLLLVNVQECYCL